MKKSIPILAALLALQLVFAGGMLFTRDRFEPFVPDEVLLPFDRAGVREITITDREGASLSLQRANGTWSIPALEGFPASGESIETLLEKIAGLRKGWPVATTAGAAARFSLEEGSFERKLTLAGGNDNVSLYVGTSPGLRKVHVRIPGEDPVYAVELDAFELATDPQDWIDKNILKLNAGDIERVELPDVTLVRRDDKMVPEDLADGENADSEGIDGFLEAVAGLGIRSVLGREKRAAYNQNAPELKFRLALKSGAQYEYVLSAPEEENYLVIKTTQREEFLAVDSWAVDRIRDAGRRKFVKPLTPAGQDGGTVSGS